MSKQPCTECGGKGHTFSYNPDTGVNEKMFCYHCRGTKIEPDGSWMEDPDKQDKTFYFDLVKISIGVFILGGFLYWLFKFIWV